MIEPYLRQSALDHLALAGRAKDDAGDPAFVEAVRGALGVAPPTEPNTVALGDDLALLWLGPDEWLVLRHDARPGAEAELAARLRGALDGVRAAVTEVGESLCCIAVAGPRARDLVAKGCPLDLHPRAFGGTGHCAQSHLAKAAITLHQTGDAPAFDLYTRRSFADYLWRWLEDAGREYGVAIVRP